MTASLREQRWLVLSLAFAGTAMACLLTGGLAYASLYRFGVTVTLFQALLFGAADRCHRSDRRSSNPVIGLPKNLETVIDGESLLNDGVAVVFFTIFAEITFGSSSPTWSGAASIFVREVLGGCALGIIGWLI